MVSSGDFPTRLVTFGGDWQITSAPASLDPSMWRGPCRGSDCRWPRRRPGSISSSRAIGPCSHLARRRRRSGCGDPFSFRAPSRQTGRPGCVGRDRGKTSGQWSFAISSIRSDSESIVASIFLRDRAQLVDQAAHPEKPRLPRSSASLSATRYMAATWATKVLSRRRRSPSPPA